MSSVLARAETKQQRLHVPDKRSVRLHLEASVDIELLEEKLF